MVWNIKQAARKIYEFDFSINLNNPLVVDVIINESNDCNDYMCCNENAMNCCSIEELAESFCNNVIKYNNGVFKTTFYVNRFNAKEYKSVYDEKKDYDKKIEMSTRGEIEFPGKAKHFDMVEEINKKRDDYIMNEFRNKYEKVFREAVVMFIGRLPVCQENNYDDDDDDKINFDFFKDKKFGDVINVITAIRNGNV